jgi:hypothetical protein
LMEIVRTSLNKQGYDENRKERRSMLSDICIYHHLLILIIFHSIQKSIQHLFV